MFYGIAFWRGSNDFPSLSACAQVLIKTATSSATGYYPLPSIDHSQATFSVWPKQVNRDKHMCMYVRSIQYFDN